MGSLEYHLSELAIARDAGTENYILPELLPSDKVIMDIGCGIGQSFFALDCTDRHCIGIDVDKEAIAYGKERFGDLIDFQLADAAEIPCSSNSVDIVFSAVSIPYTNIPQVLKEMRRVLKSDGRIWLTYHSKELVVDWLKATVKKGNFKDAMHKLYV